MADSKSTISNMNDFYVKDGKGSVQKLSKKQIQHLLDSLKLLWNQEISLDGKKWVTVSSLNIFPEPKYAIKAEILAKRPVVYYKSKEIQRRIDLGLLSPDGELSCDINKSWVPISKLHSLFKQGFDVFICHHSEQDEQATTLAVNFKKNGFRPWVDHMNLPMANPELDDFHSNIHHAIQKSASFLVMQSVDVSSDESELLKQCELADSLDKDIVTLKLDNSAIPTEFNRILKHRSIINASQKNEEELNALIIKTLFENKTNSAEEIPQSHKQSRAALYSLNYIVPLVCILLAAIGFGIYRFPTNKPPLLTKNVVVNQADNLESIANSQPEKIKEETEKDKKIKEDSEKDDLKEREEEKKRLQEKVQAWSKSDLLLEYPGKILVGLKVLDSKQAKIQNFAPGFFNDEVCRESLSTIQTNLLPTPGLVLSAFDVVNVIPSKVLLNSIPTNFCSMVDAYDSPIIFKVIAKTDDLNLISSLKEGLKNFPGPVIVHRPQIIKKVFNDCTEGEQIPGELALEISKMFSSKPGITLSRNKEDLLDFVTFRYKHKYNIEFGLFENADANQITYRAYGREPVTISKNDLALESVYRAKGPEILQGITESKFNDYCCFTIAHHLLDYSYDGFHLSNHKNLLIVPQVYFPSIQQPMELNSFKIKTGQAVMHGMAEAENPWIAGAGLLIGSSFISNAFVEHEQDVKRYRKETLDREKAISMVNKVIQHYATNISKAGVDVCDISYLEMFNTIHKSETPLNDLELLNKYHATHILRLKYNVAKDQLDPNYSMTATLLEKSPESGTLKQLWTQESPDFLIPEHINYRNEFFLDTGEMVELRYPDYKRVLKDGAKDDYDTLAKRDNQAADTFYESNPILLPPSINTKSQHLVYYDQWEDKQYIRPLFSVNRGLCPNKLVDYFPITPTTPEKIYEKAEDIPWSIKKIDHIDQVAKDYQLRYLVAGLLREILPVAGKVVSVNKETKTAKVLFGHRISSTQAIRHGDKLRAIRIDDKGMANPLPVQVTVSNVFNNQVDMSLAANDMELVWPELGSIEVGDIVFRPSRINHVIGFAPFLPIYDQKAPIHTTISTLNTNANTIYALANDTLFMAAKDGVTLMNILVDNIHSLGYQTQTLSKSSYQYAEENLQSGRTSRMPIYDADTVMKNMYHDLINTSNATNVVGCYISPLKGSIEIKNRTPVVSVGRYDVWIGIRNASPDTYKSDKSDLWHVEINSLHLKQQ